MKQNTYTIAALVNAGFSAHEIEQLTRISNTLRRWFELECGGGNNYASWAIERDEMTDKPYMATHPNQGESYRRAIPDREAGARKRLAKLMAGHPECTAFIQGDPRGSALYILRAGDLPEGKEAGQYYTRGIAV